MKAIIGFNHLFIEPDKLTGPGVYASQMIRNLLRLPPERLKAVRFKIFAQVGTLHHYPEDIHSAIVEVPKLRGRIRRVLWEQFRLPLLARRERIDLLVSPAFVSPLFGAPLKAAVIHDMYYRVVPEAAERFQRCYWRAMIPLTSRVCDLILTVSRSSQRDIEHYLPAARGKVVTTPLASRFAADIPVDARATQTGPRPYALIIASLTPNKNVKRLVGAIALLLETGRDIDLVHIGEDVRGELAAATAKFGVGDHVRSLGKVDDSVLITMARDALCIAVPSLYEGFGMPAIEAQALGTPLICSDRGALPEVAGDAALTFDPEDTSAIAAQIARLMDEPALRDALRAAGYANVRNFSWKRTASQTLDAFERLLVAHGYMPAPSAH